MPAVGATNPCEPVHGIAAIQIPGHYLFNDRSERTQLMLELILVGGEQYIPVILEQSVEEFSGYYPPAGNIQTLRPLRGSFLRSPRSIEC